MSILRLPARVGPGGLSTDLTALAARVDHNRRHARAQNTIDAYQRDWRLFGAWCGQAGLCHLPAAPRTLELYVAALEDAGRRASTIQRHVSSIVAAHKAGAQPSPADDFGFKMTMDSLIRRLGLRPEEKLPLLPADLRLICAALPDNLQGVRDRAVLLLGFYGAFRRSEVVDLIVADLTDHPRGIIVLKRGGKTDQEKRGMEVGIPAKAGVETCPVRAVKLWLQEASIAEGPIFRSIDRHGNIGSRKLTPKAVALIVKRAIALIGKAPESYAGHSLRAGFITAAAQSGAKEERIQKHTGHRSIPVLRRYIRRASLFDDHAAERIEL